MRRSTLYQLAFELASPRLADRRLTPLTQLGAEALATRAVFAAARERELGYFEPVARLPGFPRALRVTLGELRLAAVSAAAVADGGAGGADLSLLMQRYEAELERWALADGAQVLEAGTQALREGGLETGLPVLLLDVRLSCVLETGFVAALATASGDFFATAADGDGDSVKALEAVIGGKAQLLDGDEEVSARLERVQRYVFLPEVPEVVGDGTEPGQEDRSVDFFSAPGEGQECVEMVRRVRDLAAAGIPFDRMAVLLRHPLAYLPLLQDALRRAGVPAYFTRGTARPDPGGRAFLALLACAAENVSASRFAEYLSLGEVPFLDAVGAPPLREVPWVEPEGEQFVFKTLEPSPEEAAASARPDVEDLGTAAAGGSLRTPSQWERLLVDAAVVGGRDRWRRRLRGLERELELRLRELADEEPNRRLHLERQMERLRHLERFALPLVERLVSLPATARWGEWLDELETLAAQALRHPETVLSLLAEVRPMEDVGPVDLEHVRAVLHERLVFLRSEPPRRRYGMLFVATIEESLGRCFDVVFIPGLAEGIFPRSAFEDPLLLDEARRQVSRALPRQEDRLLQERLLLRLAVGTAERRLVLSYPSLDLEVGRSRVPSFYALDLLRAAEGRLPALRDLSQRAAFGPGPRLGWPAPERCEDAIDDAEYDLSLLQPLLRGGGDDVRGQGRFLLDCNEHLARSLRSRWWRWSPRWTSSDGLVVEKSDDAWNRTQEALAEQRLRRRSYSPTALQHFAACPYRFFLQAIQRLRPRDEIVSLEQLDPLTRGSLFHETQFVLFGELEARGLLPLDSERLVEILDLADRVLNETAARYAEELAPAIPRVWHDEIESLRTDLRGWILQVLEAKTRWKPIHYELAFGIEAGAERDPSSQREPVEVFDGMRLRGSIDLVEVDEARGRARVTDHKTGRAARDPVSAVGGGRVLQPVLYGLAAERLLADRGLEVESGRLFFCTQRGGYATIEVPLHEAARNAARSVLETVDRGITSSFLPAAPGDGDCRFCDYRAVCGPYEEHRVQRKRQDRLRELAELRSLR